MSVNSFIDNTFSKTQYKSKMNLLLVNQEKTCDFVLILEKNGRFGSRTTKNDSFSDFIDKNGVLICGKIYR